MSFKYVNEFEKLIAEFFSSPYAVSTDSCTHAIELCLRYSKIESKITIPYQTYISIPFLMKKLNLSWEWREDKWKNFYKLGDTNIYDAAVLWERGSYIKNTFMCISFQFQKHLSLGRGGIILTDNKDAYVDLIKMSHDGRERGIPWREQNIKSVGYHYYLPPESAKKGIDLLPNAINKKPKIWSYKDYPDLSKMNIFKID